MSALSKLITQEHFIKGFTLIELMITIAIIAVISAVGATSYSNAQMIARDAKRKEDLKAIATALQLYYQKNKSYPVVNCGTGNWRTQANQGGAAFYINDTGRGSGGCFAGASPIPLDQNYISKMPSEPTGGQNNPVTNGAKGYAYGFPSTIAAGSGSCPSSLAGNYYILATTLENINDPDANQQKNYKYCDNTTAVFSNNPGGYILTSP